MRHLLILCFFLCAITHSYGQDDPTKSIFNDVELHIDTNTFKWNRDYTYTRNTRQLAFLYADPKAAVRFDLPLKTSKSFQKISLLPSSDYTPVDSVLVLKDLVSFKVKFSNLSNSDFLRIALKIYYDSIRTETVIIPLFAYTETYAKLYVKNPELYIGEETTLEITTNHPENLVIDNKWTEDLPINYRLTKKGDQILLHLLPKVTGNQTINLPIRLKNPIVENHNYLYDLPLIQQDFNVKSGRLAFLNLDRNEVTLDFGSIEALEVQIDDNRMLEIGKTYRIENQEKPGGALIAEIFTKSTINNNKVLCLLRTYAYHRKSEGYLYLKDGDRARFITNFDITPKLAIQHIYIQREGQDWKETNRVYPGELINLKLEGEGLHKGSFRFVGASKMSGDTLVRNENVAFFKLRIPLDINTKSIDIFNNQKSTGASLKVTEFQRPKRFDFIDLRLGLHNYQVNETDYDIYHEGSLHDIILHFDRKKLDRADDLYGKQYLTVKVKVFNKQNSLIELNEVDNVVICPADNSARFKNYDDRDCRVDDIALNNILNKKIYNLPEWSTIEVEISHQKDKYGGQGFSKKIKVILKKKVNFDIDVSFPAGLLVQKLGPDSENKAFTNFSGVSFAMIAQMSFYHPEKLGKYRPYKIGAGFIAIDAFNFNQSDNRDIAVVLLGSLYPTSSENKLSFPLYLGFGYLMGQQEPFFLVGPGIRVRL